MKSQFTPLLAFLAMPAAAEQKRRLSMKSILFRIPLVGMLMLAMAPAMLTGSDKGDTLAYVISAGLTGSGEFGTVNLTTGAFHQIGPIEPDGYFGLARGPKGSLVSLTYAGNLDSIDPATGVPTLIGPTGLAGCLIPAPSCPPTSAFSVGGLDEKIYATDFKNSLYVLNPRTGAATLLAENTGIPASPFVLGSQNPDGTYNFADEAIWGSGGKLYVTYDAFIFDPMTGQEQTLIAPTLYQVDPETGLATVIGPTALGIGGATEVDGTSYVFDDVTNQIATIDLKTGAIIPVGTFDPGAGVIQGAATVRAKRIRCDMDDADSNRRSPD